MVLEQTSDISDAKTQIYLVKHRWAVESDTIFLSVLIAREIHAGAKPNKVALGLNRKYFFLPKFSLLNLFL